MRTFHFVGRLLIVLSLIAQSTTTKADGIVAHYAGWTVEDVNMIIRIDRSATYTFGDKDTPFRDLEMECRDGALMYDLDYRGGWANAHDVKISHAGSAIVVLQRISPGKTRIYIDKEAEKMTNFFESGINSGDTKFTFEALNKTREDHYNRYAEGNLSGYEQAKKSVLALCPPHEEKKSEPLIANTDPIIGKWSLGGFGGSSVLIFMPDGRFTFSYMTSFSHQRVTSGGRWRENRGTLWMQEDRAKQPMLCSHVGNAQTQYMANCSLTGVMNRLN